MDTATKCAYCDPATSAEAWVNIDEDYGGPYKARVMTHYRWNGWAVPAFEYKEALRVAADTHLLGAKYNDRGDAVEFASYDASRNAFVMTGGEPGDLTRFYVLYLFNKAFELYDMGYASAMAWILLAIVLVFTAIILRTSARVVYYESLQK